MSRLGFQGRGLTKKKNSLSLSLVKGISEEVMRFRSQIQDWYTRLERSSPTSPHVLRSRVGVGQNVESIPMLSPVNSPQSEQSSKCVTPTNGVSSDSSFPPTPTIAATPSTCDVLGRKTRSAAAGGASAAVLTPEVPSLTPAGLKVQSERRVSVDSLGSLDSLTPQLESSPTTTIQLSPSHLAFLQQQQEEPAKQSRRDADTEDVEDKLMRSLYVVS